MKKKTQITINCDHFFLANVFVLNSNRAEYYQKANVLTE